MPLPKKKVRLPTGQQIEGTVMPFQVGGEHFNEYVVEDGTILRVKLVATEVLRVDGAYDVEGNPIYLVASTNVTAVSSPESLKQKRDG
jgi:hypothetical protein